MAAREKTVCIRRASLADTGLICRMARIAFPATYGATLTPAQIAFMMDWMYAPRAVAAQMVGAQAYFIAECGGEAAAYLALSDEGGGLYHLQKIYVLPRFQGRGLGKTLFRFAVDTVRARAPRGCGRIELNVNRYNTRALAFYRKMGMRPKLAADFPIGNGYFMNDYILSLPCGGKR